MTILEKTIEEITSFRTKKLKDARDHIDKLAIPYGSLGRLEGLAIRLVEITDNLKPAFEKKVVFTMAGDHGIVEKGVSAFPQEVTMEMVKNFMAGGASINAFAEVARAKVVVVDMGVKGDLSQFHNIEGFIDKKIRTGTSDFSSGPAMSRDEAISAVEAGIEVILERKDKYGLDLAGTGDMGIGNTTPSTAVTSVITGVPVSEVTGRGTGIDNKILKNKISVIEKGISLNKPDYSDGLDVLAKVGGFEIGGIAGLILGCSSINIPIVIDGFISTAGALIASRICPKSVRYMIPSHKSVEKGHCAALESLGLYPPYLDLNMRLGEGTGSALMFPMVEAAGTLLTKIKTFDCANVREGNEIKE